VPNVASLYVSVSSGIVISGNISDTDSCSTKMFTTLFLLYRRTDIIKHEIKTTSEPPISLRPYRIHYARRDEVKKLLNQMLKDGHIVPSKSPWSSPIVLQSSKC
jgi:hypothetical protein